MKSFIDRNPKEKAVEEAFAVLARNGYESERPDPADNVFVVAEQLKAPAGSSQGFTLRS
ncbi:hypothetical protein QMK56_10250 [Pseudomonas protegens]|uniref:hypothetical protein n=1 Tax=Pseudomonas protegens TaxID=380021 RepID=UPI002A368A57|nr:hypothetical protein [Pseudomonas protegens]MDX9681877.1 hypothetical protein [Pseudomonas protegens]